MNKMTQNDQIKKGRKYKVIALSETYEYYCWRKKFIGKVFEAFKYNNDFKHLRFINNPKDAIGFYFSYPTLEEVK